MKSNGFTFHWYFITFFGTRGNTSFEWNMEVCVDFILKNYSSEYLFANNKISCPKPNIILFEISFSSKYYCRSNVLVYTSFCIIIF